MSKVDPITAAQLPEDWIALRREIIANDGHDVRADAGTGIEISTREGAWIPLTLHGGALAFVSREDRDTVLAGLRDTI